jgi:hypothetical protein
MNIIMGIAAAALIGLCSVLFLKKSDNPVEEAAEAYIEQEMGLDKGSIDLTPSSKEEAENSANKKPDKKRAKV